MILRNMHLRSFLNFLLRIIGLCALLFVVFVAVILIVRTPSHDREWEVGQEVLPRVVFDGDSFTIENLRDFNWTGSFEAEENYIEDSFDLRDMKSVDVIISHFSDFEGLAHIFLSFGFVDGRHVSISLETRREKGEKFSPFWGLLDQFEIIYVVATDRDLVGLRTGHRNERVYIYPTVASPEQAQELFVRLAKNINDIYEKPVMYNTLFSNCTNEITREVEAMTKLDFPITYKSILPGYFDEVLYDVGVIDSSVSFDELRRRSLVNNALVDEGAENFAVHVREMVGK
jgi:hypothetical protein